MKRFYMLIFLIILELGYKSISLHTQKVSNTMNSIFPSSSALKSNDDGSIYTPIKRKEWISKIETHTTIMEDLLYPKVENLSLKKRQHLVHSHPIYNFLHTYYRYSAENLFPCSPGLEKCYSEVSITDYISYFTSKDIIYDKQKEIIYIHPNQYVKDSKRMKMVCNYYDILLQTSMREPHFGCFGYHEWAMLYSGRKSYVNGTLQSSSLSSSSSYNPLPKHQKQLNLRVHQDIIDDLVESNVLKCSHFDAWRFFHPHAQSMNSISALSRVSQTEYEQPGCIHATMDLFKYAYSIYPMISSALLQDCLRLAILARKIDMRASPYDISDYIKEGPIKVEIVDGRKEYIQLQEQLYYQAIPLRLELLKAYQHLIRLMN